MCIFVREGVLVLVVPAGEAAVFAGYDLLKEADELWRVLDLCLAEISRMRSRR
ncbi:MAG: hypothetical protein M3R63_11540 [Actinomycetota bacterium]|nr:hypothetical protein [Actinomycetota bacterium]